MSVESILYEEYKEEISLELLSKDNIVYIGTSRLAIIDKEKKHYNVILGFSEQRRVLHRILQEMGYHLNEKLTIE